MTEENQQISREQDEQVPMPEQRHETDDHARPIERAQEEKPGIGSDDPTAVPEPTAKELSPTQSPAGGEPTAAVPLVPGGPRDEVPKGAPPPWVPGGWGPWGPARTPSGFHSATGALRRPRGKAACGRPLAAASFRARAAVAAVPPGPAVGGASAIRQVPRVLPVSPSVLQAGAALRTTIVTCGGIASPRSCSRLRSSR